MKIFFIFFISFLSSFSLLAQVGPNSPTNTDENSRGFKIDPRCECLTFWSHCSDQQLNIQGSISYFCNGSTYDYPIENGVVCFRDGAFNHCGDNEAFICLEDSNGYYEICEINDCEVTLYGTLDNNPSINGQPIGFPGGINSSASVTCQGPVVTALNTQQSPMTLLGCSRDHFFLENIGVPFSGTSFSGECLSVKLFDQDGNLVNDHAPGFGVFFGGHDITRTFIDVEPGLYQIVFELVCCNREETNCGPNDIKTAWIDFQGELAYDIIGSTGFFPNTTGFSPSSEPNGTIYSGVSGDFFTISLYNIMNSSNTNIVTELISTECDNDPNSGNNFGVQTHPSTSSFISVPFANFNGNDCTCFQLDVTYDDGCEEGITTDSWFFQSGPQCQDEFNGPDDLIFRRANQDNSNKKINIIQNPIQEQMRFHIEDSMIDNSFILNVVDVHGRLIFNRKGVFNESIFEFPFNQDSGIYFYTFQIGEDLYSGKIIKP